MANFPLRRVCVVVLFAFLKKLSHFLLSPSVGVFVVLAFP